MDPKLAEALVAKNLIPSGTEVKAHYITAGLGGIGTVLASDEFTVKRIFKNTDGDLRFKLVSTCDGSERNLPPLAIINIDGMDPERFAAVYNIKADGDAAKVGKRRGRKPKDRSKPVSE